LNGKIFNIAKILAVRHIRSIIGSINVPYISCTHDMEAVVLVCYNLKPTGKPTGKYQQLENH